MQERFGIDASRSVRLAQMPGPALPADAPSADDALEARVRAIATENPRFGFRRVLAVLDTEGWSYAKKRVHRFYRASSLQVRRVVDSQDAVPIVGARKALADHTWSVDFIHGRLADDRIFRIVSIVDVAHRECVALMTIARLTGRVLDDLLDRSTAVHETPRTIVVQGGSAFPQSAVESWSASRGVAFVSTPADVPVDSAGITARLRDELLEHRRFASVAELAEELETWRRAIHAGARRVGGTMETVD